MKYSDETATIITNSDPDSTIAHLRIDKCSLAHKPDHPLNETFEELQIRIKKLIIPYELLDVDSSLLLPILRTTELQEEALLKTESIGSSSTTSKPSRMAQISVNGDWIGFGSIFATSPNLTLEEEVHSCFRVLSGQFSFSFRSLHWLMIL